jgi:hypothetical protein
MLLARLRARLTYANVVATLALFVALGGSSYAALTITGKNVRDGSLTGKDVKKNSLTGADVRGLRSRDVSDGSLLAQDFQAGQLPAGPRGPQGLQGAKGDKGDKGDTGAAGTARAYALAGGNSCPGAPVVFCPIVRGRGVAYVVKVGAGVYCVGVNGIDAAAPDSVAVVTVSSGQVTSLMAARGRRQNSACQSGEFEVQTQNIGTVSARNDADTGSVTVAAPPTLNDFAEFTIAIL